MYSIPQITDAPLQSMSLILPDGSVAQLTIYFVPMQYGWVITSLTYSSFTLNGLRVTNNPNMLHQFRNQIPFGLACFSTSDREPSQQEDFSSGASALYILTSDEVEEYAEILAGG